MKKKTIGALEKEPWIAEIRTKQPFLIQLLDTSLSEPGCDQYLPIYGGQDDRVILLGLDEDQTSFLDLQCCQAQGVTQSHYYATTFTEEDRIPFIYTVRGRQNILRNVAVYLRINPSPTSKAPS